MENRITYKPFSPSDWFGFAGAERFEDDGEPLLGELSVDGHDALVIVDKNGVHLSWEVPVEEEEDGTQHEEMIMHEAEWDAAHASRAVARLERVTTSDQLRILGAKLREA